MGWDFQRMKLFEYYWIIDKVRELRPKETLDAGCGSGGLAAYLNILGFKTYGIDLDPLERANRLAAFNEYKLNEKLFRKEDMRKTSFQDKTFDLIYCLSTLINVGLGVYGDPKEEEGDKRAIKEFIRILKDNGRILITLAFGERGIRERQVPYRVYDRKMVKELIENLEIVEEKLIFFDRESYSWKEIEDKEFVEKNFPKEEKDCLGLLFLVLKKGGKKE